MSAKQVAQWGNSLAIRISKQEAEELGWERKTPIKASIVEGGTSCPTVRSNLSRF